MLMFLRRLRAPTQQLLNNGRVRVR